MSGVGYVLAAQVFGPGVGPLGQLLAEVGIALPPDKQGRHRDRGVPLRQAEQVQSEQPAIVVDGASKRSRLRQGPLDPVYILFREGARRRAMAQLRPKPFEILAPHPPFPDVRNLEQPHVPALAQLTQAHPLHVQHQMRTVDDDEPLDDLAMRAASGVPGIISRRAAWSKLGKSGWVALLPRRGGSSAIVIPWVRWLHQKIDVSLAALSFALCLARCGVTQPCRSERRSRGMGSARRRC